MQVTTQQFENPLPRTEKTQRKKFLGVTFKRNIKTQSPSKMQTIGLMTAGLSRRIHHCFERKNPITAPTNKNCGESTSVFALNLRAKTDVLFM